MIKIILSLTLFHYSVTAFTQSTFPTSTTNAPSESFNLQVFNFRMINDYTTRYENSLNIVRQRLTQAQDARQNKTISRFQTTQQKQQAAINSFTTAKQAASKSKISREQEVEALAKACSNLTPEDI